jgi:hypothetical protein
MKKNKTNRGFGIIEFADRNGQECSLQKSSIATESCIWLGVDDANPLVLEIGKGWVPVSFPENTLFHTRMHLNRKQVKALLPHLTKFAETGEF